MEIKKQITQIAASAALLLLGVFAQAAPPIGASFLEIEPTARLAAMGTSGTGITADASALFINPGALGALEGQQLMATHTELLLNSRYDALGFTHALPDQGGVIGLSAIYLSRGKIEARNENQEATGSIRSFDAMVALSLGRKISDRFTYGLTLKEIQQHIGSDSAQGIAFDAGVQTQFDRTSVGLAVKNVGSKMGFISEAYSLPAQVTAGVGYQISKGFLVSLDGAASLVGGKNRVSLGSEFYPVTSVALRAGYLLKPGNSVGDSIGNEQLSGLAGLGAGLGLRISRYQFDYAFVPQAALSASHFISLSAKF